MLIFSKRKICIDLFIKSLIDSKGNFELTDKSNIDKYLGVDIKDYADGSYEIRQPYLIKRIIDELKLEPVNT